MENITRELIIKYATENIIELRSIQSKLCLPIINRIYKKMLGGVKFEKIKVLNDIICDGHHRYIASIFANYPIEVTTWDLPSNLEIFDWKSIEFEESDWDKPDYVNKLNISDAEYNNISIEEIVQMLK